MKRNIYLFLVCLSFITNSFSQNVKIAWGEEIENTTKSDILRFIGQNEKSFFHTRVDVNYYKSNEIYLASNDRSTMQSNFVKQLLIPKNQLTENKEFNFIGCFTWKSKIYTFTSVYNKKEDQKMALVFEVDPSTGNLMESYTEVGKIENVKSFKSAAFYYNFSDDSSKLIITAEILNEEKDEPRKSSISVFESDFKLMYNKSFEVSQEGKKLKLLDNIIDNSGNYYQLINVIDIKEEEKKKPAYHYAVQAYYPKDNTIKMYDIDLGDSFICNTKINVSKDGNFVCAGTYSVNNKNSSTGSDTKYNYSLGIFYTSIDPLTKSINQIEYVKYDSTFMAIQKKDLYGTYIYRDGEVFGILPRQIEFDNDGGFKLIVEQSFSEWSGGSNTISSYTSYSNHLINVFSIDRNNKLAWNVTLTKMQRTRDDYAYFSSYACFIKNDVLNFIYNDNKFNFTRQPGKKRKDMILVKDAALMVTSIDKNGVQKTNELSNTSTLEFYAKPRLTKMYDDGEIFMYAQKIRGNYKFGKITIE